MQTYQHKKTESADVLDYKLKKLNLPFNVRTKSIQKKYNDQLIKPEGGAVGDEDKIAVPELAKCKELNTEIQKYLA